MTQNGAPLGPSFWLLRVAGVAVPLFCTFLFAPSPVQAGCNRHVFVLPDDGAPTSDRQRETPATSDTPSRPCYGLFCSQGQQVPVLPVTVAPQPMEQWICLPGWASCGHDSSWRLPPDLESMKPIRQPVSIFHPPRFS